VKKTVDLRVTYPEAVALLHTAALYVASAATGSMSEQEVRAAEGAGLKAG
jgi:hypothetical protein